MAITRKEVPVTLDRDVNRMRNRLQRFFDEPFGFDLPFPMLAERRMQRLMWSPAVEATENDSAYLITAELPGISPESVEVSVSEGSLTLKGHKLEEKKEEDKDATYHLWERSYGEFERTFRFPMPVQDKKVVAEFANGILRITVPKLEIKVPETRTVPIATKT